MPTRACFSRCRAVESTQTPELRHGRRKVKTHQSLRERPAPPTTTPSCQRQSANPASRTVQQIRWVQAGAGTSSHRLGSDRMLSIAELLNNQAWAVQPALAQRWLPYRAPGTRLQLRCRRSADTGCWDLVLSFRD